MGWARAVSSQHASRSGGGAGDVASLPNGRCKLSGARRLPGSGPPRQGAHRISLPHGYGGRRLRRAPTTDRAHLERTNVAADFSVVKDGAEGQWTAAGFVLEGYGWTGLVADLLGPWRQEDKSEAGVVPENEPRELGPFRLAYLEALVRIADWRASDKPSKCIKLSEVRRGD